MNCFVKSLMVLVLAAGSALAAVGEYTFYRLDTPPSPMLTEHAAPVTGGALMYDGVKLYFEDVLTQAEFTGTSLVDTDAKLRAALLIGGTIIIRSGAQIEPTDQYFVGVEGTRILGGGGDAASQPEIKMSNAAWRYIFYVTVPEVEIAYLKITGIPPGGGPSDHIGIVVPGVLVEPTGHRLHVHDCELYNLSTAITAGGGVGALPLEGVTIERCYIHSFSNYGILFDWNKRGIKILNNRILGRITGEGHAVLGNGIGSYHGTHDILVSGNEIAEVDRAGVEIPFGTERAVVINNWVHDTGATGISVGPALDADVCHNRAENVKSIGIEIVGEAPQSETRIRCIGNSVKGVSVETGVQSAVGISIDKCVGALVSLNNVEDIVIDTGILYFGLQIRNSDHCAVHNNWFRNCGVIYIFVNNDTDDRRHTVLSNTMISTSATVAKSVETFNGATVVKNNSIFAFAGSGMNTLANSGLVQAGDDNEPMVIGAFTGSNMFFDAAGVKTNVDRPYVKGAITTTAVDILALSSHYTILVDATAGNRIVTLPTAASSRGRPFVIKKIDATANTVTIDADASETIDGATTLVISAQWAGKQIQSDAAAWYVTGTLP